MGSAASELTGPDLTLGVALSDIPADGPLAGHADGEAVLLSRIGGELYAVGAGCTHYGGPLAEGLVVGDTVRCPWHHARFCLRTGEAIAAPAIDALARWQVDVEGDRAYVRGKLDKPAPRRPPTGQGPQKVLIVGGGAAGFAAAERLRREGFDGDLVMASADEAPPCDRPNLSKDYLAGHAPEEWIPLKGADFYEENRIDLRLGTEIVGLDLDAGRARTALGEDLPFDALLLATGAEPVRLGGAFQRPEVHVLRSLADCRSLIAAAENASSALVVGASFIGLEVAASLTMRGLKVHVVAPEAHPLERVMGPDIGRFIRGLHEARGVSFHLGQTAAGIEDARVLHATSGETVEASLLVMGVGVKPRVGLAETAGLKVDNGVIVDAMLRTSHPKVFAAGDIARYPDRRSGGLIRVEHWVVAERQGQAAALNILGEQTPFTDAPFFWSNHYDAQIHYVGHAPRFDRTEIEGSIEDKDATVRYFLEGKLLAAASIGRDVENLKLEVELETQIA